MPKGILNKASLVMVPEAPIDGTMPSVFPEDRSGDFTFTRGSNLSATRVASNGLIEKGRENLLLQSNQFDTTWTNTGTTETGGQADKDGGTDAWLLESTTAAFDRRINQLASISGVHTFSIYAKASASNWLSFYNGTDRVYFDLENGVLGSSESGTILHKKIEDYGNGWYRCIAVFNRSITYVSVILSNGDGNSFVDLGNSIYIQDAQLEVGLVATDYIESGATTGTAGLLENEPRIDFTGGGCGALLLEPQRSNLIKYSEYINPSVISWSKFFDTIITNNDAVSPDGTKNATKIACPSVGSARIDAVVSSIAAGTYIYSCYAKGDVSNLYLNVYQDSSGTTLSSTQISTLINGSDWTRIDVTFTSTATSTIRFIYNTLPNGEHFYLWGAQVEEGSYPTSYIPTHGSAVTRLKEKLADSIDIDSFTSTYNTLFFDWGDMEGKSTFNNDIVRGWATMDNTFPVFRVVSLSDGKVRYQVYTSVSSESANYTCTTRDKVAFVFNGLNSKLFINGSLVYAYSLDVTQGLRKFNYNGFSRNVTNQFIIFPTALTDEECSALTQP